MAILGFHPRSGDLTVEKQGDCGSLGDSSVLVGIPVLRVSPSVQYCQELTENENHGWVDRATDSESLFWTVQDAAGLGCPLCVRWFSGGHGC